MTDKLKPCPFCGGRAIIKDHSINPKIYGDTHHTMTIQCLRCGVEFTKRWTILFKNFNLSSLYNKDLRFLFNRRFDNG